MPLVRRFLTAETALRAAIWSIVLAVVTATKTDPDLWGHVRFGIDMIRDFSVRQVDTYSFTSDRPWVNHEWAAEVLTGGAFMSGGNTGLILLKLLVVASVLLLLYVTLKREGVTSSRRLDLLVVIAAIMTLEQAHNVRPQLFSLLFFSVLLACLMSYRRRQSAPLIVPVLFAVWANFHGGWIVGGGVLVVWTLALSVSRESRAQSVALVGVGMASLAATLVNPEGLGLLRFLRETVGLSRADISEWQPVYALGTAAVGMWALTVVLAIVGMVNSFRTQQLRAERAAVVMTLAVLAFQVTRLYGFFVLATLFLFGGAILRALPQSRRSAEVATNGARDLIAAGVLIMIIGGAMRATAINAACVQVDVRTTPEPGAVEFFKERLSKGRLLVWFTWGEYALWHLAPDLRVSVDGRRETVYSAEVQQRHLRFYFDSPGGAALPDELAADYVWIPKRLPGARRMAAMEGWTQLYAGDESVIFGHAAMPTQAPASVPQRTGARCFPNH